MSLIDTLKIKKKNSKLPPVPEDVKDFCKCNGSCSNDHMHSVCILFTISETYINKQ